MTDTVHELHPHSGPGSREYSHSTDTEVRLPEVKGVAQVEEADHGGS